MKNSHRAQSATSLPRAPRDDADSRTFRYFLMMIIRVVCFVLMVVITPYGWYTWLLGVGAIFLPYVAVVIANVAQGGESADRVSPEKALPATSAPAPVDPGIVRIQETRTIEQQPPDPDARS